MLGMYESWVLFTADEPLTLIKYKGINDNAASFLLVYCLLFEVKYHNLR